MKLHSAHSDANALTGGLTMACTLALLAIAGAVFGFMMPTAWGAQPEKPEPVPNKPKVGLQVNDEKACKGYTLLAPTTSPNAYLIDMEGHTVQSWKSDSKNWMSCFLLENGHLLRTGAIPKPPFFGMGTTGRIQEQSWDGELVWDYSYHTDDLLPHHDICRLPNGNVLMIAWQKKSAKDAIAAGRRPETVKRDGYMLSGSILEVQPTGKTTGKIVWEWHAWDHLIQDFDDKQSNHGAVGAHPELIDLNFGESTFASIVAKPEELEKLRAIGYVGSGAPKNLGLNLLRTDWLHMNALTYNAELDQIMVSIHEFSELWIIDHNTTTKEAASHKGGKSGKGGDLLYRWGNPRSYRAGTVKDQKLFGQHDAQWISKGLPGAGNILVFNNGLHRVGGAYSSIDEIVPVWKGMAGYEYHAGKAYGPDKAAWSYAAPKKIDFYAAYISGTQRLANGNTLICNGISGALFEVTPREEIVWKYVYPEKVGILQPFGVGLFRARRYAPDYPGLAGKPLKPGKTIEELKQKGPAKEAPKETPAEGKDK